MSEDCLFCRIGRGEIPSRIVHEDEHIIAFEDIDPQAPTHLLVVPRKHIPTLNDLQAEDAALVGEMHCVASRLMQQRQHDAWRAVINCNAEAGQSVFHLHLHALGGRGFRWPPG